MAWISAISAVRDRVRGDLTHLLDVDWAAGLDFLRRP